MPGPAPLPDGERARSNTPTKTSIDVELLPAVPPGADPPAPPAELPDELLDAWDALWSQPYARTIAASSVPALRRLFELRARHARLLAIADREGLITGGSTGQLVAHPALKAAAALEKPISDLEDRFALTPKAQQAMGIRMGHLAAQVKAHPEVFAGEEPQRADPRLANPGAAAAEPRRHHVALAGTPPGPRRG